ncbi:hypothetical protein [Zhongshania sp.]|uniref:hypothetical protein n=1 Tax=Zhongshania sp. TaxID=1971902 RepID=UPI003564448B
MPHLPCVEEIIINPIPRGTILSFPVSPMPTTNGLVRIIGTRMRAGETLPDPLPDEDKIASEYFLPDKAPAKMAMNKAGEFVIEITMIQHKPGAAGSDAGKAQVRCLIDGLDACPAGDICIPAGEIHGQYCVSVKVL